MDDAAAEAYGDGLCPIGGAQLFHDVLDVDLHGFFGDEESCGNLAVAIAAGDLAQYLDFAAG